MKLPSLLIGLVAILGALAGLLAPKSAEALIYSVHLDLWPGGGSTLQCGWHSGPCADNDALVVSGTALDWATSGNISFYTKLSTDSPQFSVAGNSYMSTQSQTACSHQRYASIYDNKADWRAGVFYIHTAGSGTSTIPINTAQYTLATTSSVIGSAANETGCTSNGVPTWYGYHVHQQIDGGFTLANYPDHSTCNRPNVVTADCDVANSFYMGYANWNVLYP